MVVLKIVAQKNGETIFFDEPITQVHYMRLVLCSLYNSWHNLKMVGILYVDGSQGRLASLPQGHYNLVSLVKELKSSIDENKSGNKLQIETNKPNSVVKLFNPVHDSHQIKIIHALADLMGTATELGALTYVKKL